MPDNIDKVAYPSLSDDGWVMSSLKQADAIMASFLASDKSQSYLFDQEISSYGAIIARYNNTPDLLLTEIKSTLQTLFNRYFNSVVVECTDMTKPSAPSRVIIGIFVEFQTADGTVSNISKLTQITGSKFKLINDIIINGET